MVVFQLPDFLEALETQSGNLMNKEQNTPGPKIPQGSPAVPRTVSPEIPTNKLRYEPYDTPQAIPSLRTGLSASRRLMLSFPSHQGTSSGGSSSSLIVESQSRTMTQNNLITSMLLDEVDDVTQVRVFV
jgi:hypothetical protein